MSESLASFSLRKIFFKRDWKSLPVETACYPGHIKFNCSILWLWVFLSCCLKPCKIRLLHKSYVIQKYIKSILYNMTWTSPPSFGKNCKNKMLWWNYVVFHISKWNTSIDLKPNKLHRILQGKQNKTKSKPNPKNPLATWWKDGSCDCCNIICH